MTLTHHHKKAYGSWAGNRGGYPPDPERCAKEVHERHGMRFHQCSRNRGHGPDGAFCKQHDPERIARKNAEYSAKDRAKRAKIARNSQFVTDCKDAIRAIAAGHNDPRTLAQSIIDKLEQDQ